MELTGVLFKPKLEKQKKSNLKKFLVFPQKLSLCFKNPILQKFLYFLIVREMETLKKKSILFSTF